MADDSKKPSRYFSCRWRLCYVCSIAILLLQAMRVDLSMAFVCMLKSPNRTHTEDTNNTETTNKCSSDSYSLNDNQTTSTESYDGEFDWGNNLQANMLSGYFYGYTLTNLIGGTLADKYGAKNILGGSLVTSSVLTLLYPSLSRVSGYFTLVLRVLTGLVSGPMFPSIQSLFGRWAPPLESGVLLGIVFSAQYIGTIVCLSVSGYLCVYGFDNGWGSIFYIFGGVSLLFSCVWFYVVYDTPNVHPSISERERSYLNKSIKSKSKIKSVPWKEIMISPAVWAIIIAHTCYNWTDVSLTLLLPLFMKEALSIETTSNGLMSSAPFLSQAISMPLFGVLVDFLRSKKYLSTRTIRVLFQSLCFILSAAVLVLIGFLTCEQASLAGILFLLCGIIMALYVGGFNVNHADIAPRYAGVLYGITNTFSSLPGFLSPLIAKTIAPNGTQEEWQHVLFMFATFSVLGAVFYATLARGEIQDWAHHGEDEDPSNERKALNLPETEMELDFKDSSNEILA
ncbi:sialin-like isoform X2 [Argonauta hians]